MTRDNQATFLRQGELLFGKYRIERIVGRGGYGRVYKARDTLMDRDVAVKELLLRYAENPLVIRRFIQEARAAGRLQHPNIVTIYNLERSLDDGRFFLIMEFINGASLRQIFRKKSRIPPKHIEAIAMSVLTGLEHAHAHSVIHRDIKPDNIMVTVGEQIKIADFGVAKLPVHEGGFTQLSGGGMPAGTAAYLSPEQVKGEEVGPTSDLYSLGVTLYELATGTFYFDVDACKSFYEVQDKIVRTQPLPPSKVQAGVPPWIDELVLGLLMKDATARVQSAAEALSVLQNALGATAPRETPATAQATPPRQAHEPNLNSARDSDDGDSPASHQLNDRDAANRINVFRRGKTNLPGAVFKEKTPADAGEKNSLVAWSASVTGTIARLEASSGRVFVATDKGMLKAFYEDSGETLIEVEGPRPKSDLHPLPIQLAVAGNQAALLEPTGAVSLYEVHDRNPIWRSSCFSSGTRTPVLAERTSEQGVLYSRRHGLFWYGRLLYLFSSLASEGNQRTILIDALELSDGSIHRLLDTGLNELRSVVVAPSDASELVEGHVWACARNEIVACDLLSSKVLKRKSVVAEIECLQLTGHFPRYSREAGNGTSRHSTRDFKENSCYSGFSERPVLVSLECAASGKRIVSVLDIESLEPYWAAPVSGPTDRSSRYGNGSEVYCTDLSVYVLAGEHRNHAIQLDIHSGEVQNTLHFERSIVSFGRGRSGFIVIGADGWIGEYSNDKNELVWSFQLKAEWGAKMFSLSASHVIVAGDHTVGALG